MFLSTSQEAIIHVRLPASLDPSFRLSLMVSIRDTLHSEGEFFLPSIRVEGSVTDLDALLNSSSSSINGVLHDDDMLIRGQLIYSSIQLLDEMTDETLLQASRSEWCEQKEISSVNTSL